MWKTYLRFDSWMISNLQNLYLWLLDRTGIYVATLMFITYAGSLSPDIIRGKYPWWNCAFIALIGLVVILPYLKQDRGDVKRYNAFAIEIEGLIIRHAFNGLQIGLGVGSAIAGDYLSASGCFLMLIYQYLWVIKIRNRDKKSFFEENKRLAYDTF